LWKIAPPHGQVMKILMKDQLPVHLTRLMAQYQVMQIIVIFQEQLIIVIVHARMIIVLQALQHHYTASCHKVTKGYQVAM
jgi:hypothetical protein